MMDDHEKQLFLVGATTEGSVLRKVLDARISKTHIQLETQRDATRAAELRGMIMAYRELHRSIDPQKDPQ